MRLVSPDRKHVSNILAKYRKLYFYETDGALHMLFKSYPHNKNIFQILLKVTAVNQLYRTNIFDPFTVAKHIHKIGTTVDKALLKGDHDIIDKIADVKFGSKRRYFYSFATKYCSWHHPEHYFIYDSFVDELLWRYRKKYGFDNYRRRDAYVYPKFHGICLKFKKFFGLTGITNKTLDEFLWLETQRLEGWL